MDLLGDAVYLPGAPDEEGAAAEGAGALPGTTTPTPGIATPTPRAVDELWGADSDEDDAAAAAAPLSARAAADEGDESSGSDALSFDEYDPMLMDLQASARADSMARSEFSEARSIVYVSTKYKRRVKQVTPVASASGVCDLPG